LYGECGGFFYAARGMVANCSFDSSWQNDSEAALFELCPGFCRKHVGNRHASRLIREHIPNAIPCDDERIIGTVVWR
jgi:hypothetical protein